MRKKLIDRLTDPMVVGIQSELLALPEKSWQSNYLTIILNLIGYTICFLIIRDRFDDRIGCFMWYVLIPVMFNIISVGLFRAFTFFTAGKSDEFYGSYKYIIPGALIYTFTYSYIVVIYRAIPQAWILIFMPVILSCYFKGLRWFHVQTVLQGIFLVIMLATQSFENPFDIGEPSNILSGAFFAMIMLQFSHAIYGEDTLKRNIYANMSAEEARMEVQKVFEENLSDDCQPYIRTIDFAAGAILKSEENERVHEYAQKLIKAGEALREAISEDKT
ncbi:MAG: hypothetical protein K5857_01240 [Lachnospiraceae bacterium]|nr:hypothetical protein [Lachnospiraceae bacterium]